MSSGIETGFYTDEYLLQLARSGSGLDDEQVMEIWDRTENADFMQQLQTDPGETWIYDLAERVRRIMTEELETYTEKPLVTVKDGKTVPVKRPPRLIGISFSDLEKEYIPPLEWIVKDLLPVGLAMIGAPSKYFKSYMALDLCLSVGEGAPFLGFQTVKNACVYMDLESTKRRPRDRMRQILGDRRPPDNCILIDGTQEVGQIGAGFEDQVNYLLDEYDAAKLLVIDVLQLVRQRAKRNQTGYDRDYDDLKALKRLADQRGICILLIHHTRKMKDPTDIYNELSGSVGVMGALDCVWMITKESRDTNEGTLHITGRDLESKQLKIRFNKQCFRWECLGTVEDVEGQRLVQEYQDSRIIQTVRKLVETHGGSWEGSAQEVKDASIYFGTYIHDDVRQIGKEINRFEGLLWAQDGIEYDFRNAGGKRKYIFNALNVSNALNAPNVSNALD